MNATEVRELPSDELRSRLEEAKEELFNLRFQQATGQLENYGKLGEVRRDVARILTILKEREMGIEPEPQEVSRRRRRRAEKGEPGRTERTREQGAEAESSGGDEE